MNVELNKLNACTVRKQAIMQGSVEKKTIQKNKSKGTKKKTDKPVRAVNESGSDSDELVYSIDQVGKETVKVSGQKLKIIIDTGIGRNLIGEAMFKFRSSRADVS